MELGQFGELQCSRWARWNLDLEPQVGATNESDRSPADGQTGKKRHRRDQCNFQLNIWDSRLPVLLPHQDKDLVDFFPWRELFCGTFKSLVWGRSAILMGTSHFPFFVWIMQPTAKSKLVSSKEDRELILVPRIKTLTLQGDLDTISGSSSTLESHFVCPIPSPPPPPSALNKI